MQNADISAMLDRIAELLEIKGEIRFKIQAYQKAARAVENHERPLTEIHAEGGIKGLEEIPGIGEGIAKKIEEYIGWGRVKYYEELKAGLPKGVDELIQVPHLGPKTAMLLSTRLKIDGVDALEKALAEHRVAALPRMSGKTEEKLLKGIAIWRQGQARLLLGEALPLAESVVKRLRKLPIVSRVEYAGSLRRMKETVGDLDFLASPKKAADAPALMQAFLELPEVVSTGERGETKATVRMRAGRRTVDADLRVVAPESFGAAYHYFTGSKMHNIRIREIGIKLGLKVNEYGVFRGEKSLGGAEENGVFKALGLAFIPPEMRENAGEIEAAQGNKLPAYLEEKHIRGDLHTHSNWSDGENTVEEMAEAARKLGYEYLGLCDHSQAVRIANGMTEARLRARNKAIDKLNAGFRGFRILKGVEVDIMKDGTLDFPDELLAELDVVVASVHSYFSLPGDEQTRRLVRAIGNRHVHIIGHPTGRMLAQREAYPVNMTEVIRAAAGEGKALELNAQPWRLDLPDVLLRQAGDAGVMVSIDSDSHDCPRLALARQVGVPAARRGWLGPEKILNALPLAALLKKLAH
jgi:DNA polymerase (family 10)